MTKVTKTVPHRNIRKKRDSFFLDSLQFIMGVVSTDRIIEKKPGFGTTRGGRQRERFVKKEEHSSCVGRRGREIGKTNIW
jgi:hypothetical protein